MQCDWNPYKKMRHQRAHFLSLSLSPPTLNMHRLRKGYLKTQKEHGHLQTRKRALTRNQVLQAEIELEITHMTELFKGDIKTDIINIMICTIFHMLMIVQEILSMLGKHIEYITKTQTKPLEVKNTMPDTRNTQGDINIKSETAKKKKKILANLMT